MSYYSSDESGYYVLVVNYIKPKIVYFPELILNTEALKSRTSLRKGSHAHTCLCGEGNSKEFFSQIIFEIKQRIR